jgi:RimJ/RimL family protein N-acetyltransferase
MTTSRIVRNEGALATIQSMLDRMSLLRAGQLQARLLRPADAVALHHLTDDRAITANITFLQSPFTLDDAHRLVGGLDDGCHRFMGLWHGNTLIGVLGVRLYDPEIELGYWIGSAFQRQGFATEVLISAVEALRAVHPHRSIFAECRPENGASRRVLEKAGFRSTGIVGKRVGRIRYELIPTERGAASDE